MAQSATPAPQGVGSPLTDVFSRLSLMAPSESITASALSRVFASLRPDLITPPSATPTSPRAARYVAVKLARALLDYFADVPSGTPPLRPEVARFVRDCASDKASGTTLLDAEETIVGLGEVVLCAALYSHRREEFVSAVCSLEMRVQDLLAGAVHAVLDTGDDGDLGMDGELVDEYRESLEGDEVENQLSEGATEPVPDRKPAQRAAMPPSTATSEATTANADPPPLITSNILTENVSARNAPSDSNSRNGNTPHARSEESALREKILYLEQRIREQKAENENKPTESNGATNLGPPRASPVETTFPSPTNRHGRARRALHEENGRGPGALQNGANKDGAENDDDVEASRSRLEERLGDLRDAKIRVGELEAENAALRDSETRMVTRVAMLESQLDATNARAETLVSLSEGLARDLQTREREVRDMRDENGRLANRLDEATVQITGLLGAAASTGSMDGSQNVVGCEAGIQEKVVGDKIDGSKTVESVPGGVNVISGADVTDGVVSSSMGAAASAPMSAGPTAPVIPAPLDKSAVSAALHAELGVAMPWNDIVECVRGVIEAMREMDEVDAAEQELQQEPSTVRAGEIISRSSGSTTSAGASEGRAQSGTAKRKIPTLQDFIEVDMQMEAAGGEKDDDFDFAADQTNVEELRSCGSGKKATTSSPSPRFDGVPVVPRRRSSVPSLPTVPEEDEVFDERSQKASTDSDDDARDDQSVSSLYSTPSSSPERRSTKRGIEETVLPAEGAGPSSPNELHANHPARPLPRRSSPKRGTPEEGLSPRPADHWGYPADQEVGTGTVVGIPYEGAHGDQPVGVPLEPAASGGAIESLIQQLADSREELCLVQTYATAKERECSDIRKELSLLINEVDGLLAERDARQEHETGIVAEKERLVKHLQASLQARTAELAERRSEVEQLRAEISKLRTERAKLTDELFTVNKKLSEEMRLQEIKNRSQQVEIARLTAQVESTEIIARKIRQCVADTGDLNEETSRERYSYYQELMQALRSEKKAAEQAREETRVLVRKQSEKLSEIHDSAKAAAVGREYNVDLRMTKSRKSTRGVNALRRLVGKRDSGVFDTSIVMRPVGSASAAAAAGDFPSRPILPR